VYCQLVGVIIHNPENLHAGCFRKQRSSFSAVPICH